MTVPLSHQSLIGMSERRSDRYHWTTREIATLRAVYPDHGIVASIEALPRRTPSAIYQKVRLLGLCRHNVNANRERWTTTAHIDDAIRRAYADGALGTIKRLSGTVGRPGWWIRKRAMQLGIAVPRFRAFPWTAAEDDILSANAHKAPLTIKRALARAGYKRSDSAIEVRIKRLRLDTTDPDHYTGRGLADILGVDSKAITRWIEKGWLRAHRRGTARVSEQGGDQWWIRRADVRRFIIENVAAVDFRKADKFWLVDLLTGGARQGNTDTSAVPTAHVTHRTVGAGLRAMPDRNERSAGVAK